MKRLILVMALGLSSCATVPPPKTPAQTVYALEGTYAASLSIVVGYRQLPPCPTSAICQDPAVMNHLLDYDRYAYTALMDAQTAVRQGLSAAVVTKLSLDAAKAVADYSRATAEVKR